MSDLGNLPKEERLERMRHSAAHIMAEAVTEMFPEAKLGIGPPIDTGFYYDFDLPRHFHGRPAGHRRKDASADCVECAV